MRTHEVKCWPEFFELLFTGVKTCEVRYNDRRYAMGNLLVIKEWDDRKGAYTGRQVTKVISHVLEGVPGGIPPLGGLQRNFVALSLKDLPAVTQQIHIVTQDALGRVAVLSVDTDAKWIFTDVRHSEPPEFRPAALVEVQMGGPGWGFVWPAHFKSGRQDAS